MAEENNKPIDYRTLYEQEVAAHNATKLQLQELQQKPKLSGTLPICSSCKKIRDEKNEWSPLEVYIQARSEALFTHTFCPDCVRRLYPEIFADHQQLNPSYTHK